MNRSTRVGLILSGFALIFLKLFSDLYKGASERLNPNLANDAINWAWPLYNQVKASMQSGILPTWNPDIALGAPIFPDLSLAMFYPLNWLIYLIDVPDALLTIHFLTVMIGMVCMYYYTRYLELAWPARILCVVLFAYALFTEAFHPVQGSSFCWLPLLLLLMHRYFDDPGYLHALSISIVLALCFLAGFVNFFVYTCMILFVYGSVLLMFSWPQYRLAGIASRVAMLVPALLLMLGLVAIQIVPAFEFSSLSVRSVLSDSGYQSGSIFENFSFGLMIRNYFLTNLAYLYANSNIPIPSGIYYLSGALLLIPFAFSSKRYRVISVALAASFVVMALFMLSNQVPALSFLQEIPLINSLRIHSRAMAYAQFLLIVLAGVGLSALCQRAARPSEAVGRSRELPGIALFLGYVALLGGFALSIRDNEWFFASFLVCTFLIVLVLLRPAGSPGAVHCCWIIALVIVVDVTAHRNNRFLVPAFVNDEVPFVNSNIGQARNVSNQYRVLFVPDSEAAAYELANIGSKYQISNISAYTPLTLARWQNFIRYLGGAEEFDRLISQSVNARFYGTFLPSLLRQLSNEPRILEMASLRYWFSRTGTTENGNALPRAYAVSHYVQTNDEVHSLSAIKANLPHIEDTVILENASPSYSSPSAPTRVGADVVITRYSADRVELDVDVAEPSIVVLTDAFYPGWRAYVDDKPATVFRANSLFRAVEVPPGRHQVVFRFHSNSLFWGMVVSLASAALVVGLLVTETIRRRSAHRPCSHP